MKTAKSVKPIASRAFRARELKGECRSVKTKYSRAYIEMYKSKRFSLRAESVTVVNV